MQRFLALVTLIISSPLRAPAIIPAVGTPPVATRNHPHPEFIDKSIRCEVDKYQAWQHYLIGYMKTQAAWKDHSLLLKIMEMKGSFEAEWDLAISITKQEIPSDDLESTKQQASTHAQNNSSTDQASIHDKTRTHDQVPTHDTNSSSAQRPLLSQPSAFTPAAD